MFVKFKNSELKLTTSGTTGAMEQKLFKQGESVGWLLSLSLTDDISADDLDALLVKENICDIALYATDEEKAEPTTHFTGYEKVTSCIIRYTESKNTVEIQLAKVV